MQTWWETLKDRFNVPIGLERGTDIEAFTAHGMNPPYERALESRVTNQFTNGNLF
jgi:hypothetical protein